MNRIGIFVFYDKGGIVDDYIEYLLSDINENLNRLIIVVNGCVTQEAYKRLLNYSKEIVIRKNKGFDAGAWQEIIVKYLKQDELAKYDQLVLFNDTFYGPFYPFSNVFKKMRKKYCDFWGLTIHSELFNENVAWPYDHILEHLQTYFLVFNSKVIKSKAFRDYWTCLPKLKNGDDVIGKNETVLTQYFAKAGFKYAALCDTRAFDKENHSHIRDHYFYDTYMLLTQYEYPVLKRKVVSWGNVDELNKCLKYIENNSHYDVNMIVQHINRLKILENSVPPKRSLTERIVNKFKKITASE